MMKKAPMPLGLAIGLLIAGLVLGSIFVFGMQYQNAEVTQEDCALVQTRFVSYKEIRQAKRPTEIKEISVTCANGKTYFIDGVSVNKELVSSLSALSGQEEITLLIHPYSSTVLELSHEGSVLLALDDTVSKLETEASGFLYLGFFLYFTALLGLYHIVLHILRKVKKQY